MKRLIIIALLLASATVWAQDVVRDSTAVHDSALGDEPRKHVSKEANVLGAPVYYDINGNIRGTENPSPFYHRPEHHYLNNLDNSFCSFFLEGELLIGSNELAFGANFTYLPKRWGAYGSFMYGINHDYLSAGPVLRLSDYDSRLDWQLYCGLMLGGRQAGATAGLRLALPQRNSEFCWTSASAGIAYVGGNPYFTFGCSLDLLAISLLTTFILW